MGFLKLVIIALKFALSFIAYLDMLHLQIKFDKLTVLLFKYS